jgi:hypothetical protein
VGGEELDAEEIVGERKKGKALGMVMWEREDREAALGHKASMSYEPLLEKWGS